MEFANEELEDFVLLRSDSVPTYHLSVVADDLDMGLTHIIRGADHISNTPKQVLQYQALGERLPVFAHLPLILGPDKSRLSKRHGATSVLAYQDMGIVPEAFRNFLALLGWTPSGTEKDREMFSSGELISFSRWMAFRGRMPFSTMASWPGSTLNGYAGIRRRSCCL